MVLERGSLGVFGFYSLKFRGIWILHPEVSEFGYVKSKHLLTLGGKIQFWNIRV